MTTRSSEDDPLESIEMLAESLANPALVCFAKGEATDDAALGASYILAVSIGRCRLFGVRTEGAADGALPLSVALAAAAEMNLRVCRDLRAGARALPERLDSAIAIEAEDLCADLLGGRLNAWAAEVALDEAYRAEDDEAKADIKKLAGALEYLRGELSLVDTAMREVAVELTLAASGHLLENWRHHLAPEYADVAPWWLIGELEQLAARIAQQESEPFLDENVCAKAQRAIRNQTTSGAEKTASDEVAAETAEFEEDEMAIAADDGDSASPTPAEERTIQYLTNHLPEILQHGNSDVWFAIDSVGAFTAHTYESGRAVGYAASSGPHKIPFFVKPSNLIEPDVQKLIDWMTTDLKLFKAAAEQVCVNLDWRC